MRRTVAVLLLSNMTDQRKAAWAGELNKPLEIVTQPLEFPDSGAVCIKVKYAVKLSLFAFVYAFLLP